VYACVYARLRVLCLYAISVLQTSDLQSKKFYAHYMTRSYSSLRLSNFLQISEMNWSLFYDTSDPIYVLWLVTSNKSEGHNKWPRNLKKQKHK